MPCKAAGWIAESVKTLLPDQLHIVGQGSGGDQLLAVFMPLGCAIQIVFWHKTARVAQVAASDPTAKCKKRQSNRRVSTSQGIGRAWAGG